MSVVAVDLAGNKSKTPATASFTTAAAPQPPDEGLTLDAEQGGAMATWHPDLPGDATYRAFLDGRRLEDFELDEYCQDAEGNPANPCTEQSVIRYPITELEESTPYTFRVDAVRADGTAARSLSGSFTTTIDPFLVPPETTQRNASESSQCAGRGGDIYIAASARAGVPVPGNADELFAGCYSVPDSSCIDTFQSDDNKLLECSDDVTELLEDVAPANRGPVISSVNDLVGQARTAFLQTAVQPLTWCLGGGCTVAFAPAPEAAAAAAVATEVAAVSWLVVVAAGVVAGVVLGVVWEILFPTPLDITGITEYPDLESITDFDTFENWWADKGDLFNDLKIYAETIKTTNQLADRLDLPFEWNDEEERRLQKVIDNACPAQRGLPAASVAPCNDGFSVYVAGGRNFQGRPMHATGAHIANVLGDGFPFPQPPGKSQWYYPGRSRGGQAATNAGYRRDWYDTDRFTPNACVGRQRGSQVCDEFPFWTTDQAVDLTGDVADVQPVPLAESLPQGSDISQFYRVCGVDDRDKFMVLPVKSWVAAGGPSFGFRVTPGGANLCMAPTLP